MSVRKFPHCGPSHPGRLAPWLLILALPLPTGSSLWAGDAASEIPYASEQVLLPGDSEAVMVEKAAKVLPRPNQTAWMRLERTFFLHFGMNTFNEVEWGSGREDPSIFNPDALDANQWAREMKNAGGELVILVTKHHDGFCMWPTRYTEHSVAASPWLGGRGDLVKAMSDAARAEGLRFGVYLSPADLYQLRTNPKGYYGNGSPKAASVIPTDPASFLSDPSKGREPAPGFGAFTYVVDDYNRYFLNQLYELLTSYGPVSVVWFDGANPDPSVSESYDYEAWYDLIRKLQPQAVISVKGPDSRWVGNEGGIGRTTEWSVIPLPVAPAECTWPDLYGPDLGGRGKLAAGAHLWWYPAEVNTSILEGWFWAPGKRVKSAAELIDFYYTSVGRNGNMLLNLPPDSRGLLPDDQLASLRGMAQVLRDTFAENLARGGTLASDSSAPGHSPSEALDGNPDSFWEAAPGGTCATLTLTLPAAASFDVISLQEAVDHRSQRIESFEVDVWRDGQWQTVQAQTTVGHKRLLRLDAPVASDRVRIRITASRREPTLAEIGLFKQALPVPAPIVNNRDASGFVTLSGPEGVPIVYTTDGTLPTAASARYSAPVPMCGGGTIQAALLTSGGSPGTIASRHFAGMVPTGWAVLPGAGEGASAAIDGDPATFWLAPQDGNGPADSLAVDMGVVHTLCGFTYLPRQDSVREGVVEYYRFETSPDGKTWTPAVAEGRFGNIRNNPVLQEVSFPPVRARFFRFRVLRDSEGGKRMSVAEISVIPASGEAR